MTTLASLDKCEAFLDAQLRPGLPHTTATPTPTLRAVTISREAGCGAMVIAEKLAQRLRAQAPAAPAPWTVFDQNLIEQVLQDHNLPLRFAKHLPEDRSSEIQETMEEIFGVHPSTWTIVEHTAETILRLTHLGQVILVGRGANLITAQIPGVFHVRLVAPRTARIAHAQQFYQLSLAGAEEFIDREDKGRARYLRKYFDVEITDPLLYHLVLNTHRMPYEAAAETIYHAALNATNSPPPA